MELTELIGALSRPAAYPFRCDQVEVLQTHISVVFLAGPCAFKIKKPVNLGFLDFSTLDLRRHFCEEEVRLNRRLAPSVYLGVVPVTRCDSRLAFEGDGEVIEWAVKMERLPAAATLEAGLARGDVGDERIKALAVRIAEFHEHADRGPDTAACGRFAVVARNARENFEQAAADIGLTVSQQVFDRARLRTDEVLEELQPLIELRAEQGMPRDTHGDLRLDHVYLLPERQPPEDVVIVDCIEFNDRFRYADPVADAAFLAMDFMFHHRQDLADTFAQAYFEATGDGEGKALLPFYISYRAAVRAKVEGVKANEAEVPEAERTRTIANARAHWLTAFSLLEKPAHKPALVLVGGLPGTGKSTVARRLAEVAAFDIIRTDELRKELTGGSANDSKPAGFEQGIYTPEWTERTYRECLRRAEHALFAGRRVLIDANFREDRWREESLRLADAWRVPSELFVCEADPEVVRSRLANRQRDASDANWEIYLHAASRWEQPGPRSQAAWHELRTDSGSAQAADQAVTILRERGLA